MNTFDYWTDLLQRQQTPTFKQRLQLILCSWTTIPGPNGTVGCVYDFMGRPLYRYKSFDGIVFYLQPVKNVSVKLKLKGSYVR